MLKSQYGPCCVQGLTFQPPNCSTCPLLLQDRSFVCLHYHLDSQGKLHPCTNAGAPGDSNNAAGPHRCGAEGGGPVLMVVMDLDIGRATLGWTAPAAHSLVPPACTAATSEQASAGSLTCMLLRRLCPVSQDSIKLLSFSPHIPRWL